MATLYEVNKPIHKTIHGTFAAAKTQQSRLTIGLMLSRKDNDRIIHIQSRTIVYKSLFLLMLHFCSIIVTPLFIIGALSRSRPRAGPDLFVSFEIEKHAVIRMAIQ